MVFEKEISSAIKDSFKALFDHDIDASKMSLQPTRKEFEGTHTFVMFPFLKVTKKSPEESGKALGDWLVEHSDHIESYNVVKGFLNLSLSKASWIELLSTIHTTAEYGSGESNGQKVMVEFSSPNTNKPLHLGHLRNNFLGDSVSRILDAAGYDVMKVNLVNDRGIHICKSMLAYEKYGNGETPQSSGIKGDHLVGNYYVLFDKEYKKQIAELTSEGMSEEDATKSAPLIKEAQALLKRWEEKEPGAYGLWEKMNGWVYDGFNQTYEAMGISFDKIYHESETYLLGKDLVNEGLQKEVFYQKEDKSVWADLTEEGLDNKLVLRGDGTSVYITQDMGTCELKHQDFPFQKSVYVVGNEQDYHFKVLFKIMAKLGREYSDGLFHLSYGMVDLPTGKMKSREGTVVDADDLIREMKETAEQHTRELGKIEGLSQEEAESLFDTIALGALKYFLLKVDPKRRMLFNPEESIEFQGHTGPFIQYTHARIASILARAHQLSINIKMPEGDISLHPRELNLINIISTFPEVVQIAADQYAPSVIAQYVFDLAKEYNGFYQEVSIFNEDNKDLVQLRLVLSSVTAKIISKAMRLLGINVPDRM